MKLRWHLSDTGYAKTTLRRKTTSLHAYVMVNLGKMEVPKGYIIDHCPPENNPLDCRLEKLRIITRKQNGENKRKREGTTSDFHGVTKFSERCFESGVGIDGVWHLLGKWSTEIDAARARDSFLRNHPGAGSLMHHLNFPGEATEPDPANRLTKKAKTTPFNGVGQTPNGGFLAKMRMENELVLCKTVRTAEEAARLYDAAVVKHNRPRSMLNFPDEHPHYEPQKKVKLMGALDGERVRVTIPSHPDAAVYVDPEVYETIKFGSARLHMNIHGKCDGVILIVPHSKTETKLHRYVKKVTDPNILVDHIDSNPLNNCASNLRVSDYVKNGQNKAKAKGKSSAFLGVSLKKKNMKWIGKLDCDGRIMQKICDYDFEAAAFRDLLVLRVFPGSHYKLNFKWRQEHIDRWTQYFLSMPNPFDFDETRQKLEQERKGN